MEMSREEELLREVLDAARRIALVRFADGRLTVSDENFYRVADEAAAHLGLPKVSRGRAGLFTHSGTSYADTR